MDCTPPTPPPPPSTDCLNATEAARRACAVADNFAQLVKDTATLSFKDSQQLEIQAAHQLVRELQLQAAMCAAKSNNPEGANGTDLAAEAATLWRRARALCKKIKLVLATKKAKIAARDAKTLADAEKKEKKALERAARAIGEITRVGVATEHPQRLKSTEKKPGANPAAVATVFVAPPAAAADEHRAKPLPVASQGATAATSVQPVGQVFKALAPVAPLVQPQNVTLDQVRLCWDCFFFLLFFCFCFCLYC